MATSPNLQLCLWDKTYNCYRFLKVLSAESGEERGFILSLVGVAKSLKLSVSGSSF